MSRRLSVPDLVRTAWVGISGRRQRSILAALGVALGIAALVTLTSAAESNRAQLLADLDAMGADLAVVKPGIGPDQGIVPLPSFAPEAVERQDGVARVGVFEAAPEGLAIYRTDVVPQTHTNGLQLAVARPDVLSAVEGRLSSGRWFDDATRDLPVVVLGSTAADRLGITQPGDRVLVGGEWYGVLGVLETAGLASDIDNAVILGDTWARDHYNGERSGDIDALYVRAQPGRINEVREVLAGAASPSSPHVLVTALSDFAQARTTTEDSLATLGMALAAIALLVGGVGIANTMVVAVLERRGEIGLRRALGARPGQIASQFVTEATMLSFFGGAAGVALGVIGAVCMVLFSGQPLAIPVTVLAVGPVLSVVVGAVAGLQPALRAARLTPVTALSGG